MKKNYSEVYIEFDGSSRKPLGEMRSTSFKYFEEACLQVKVGRQGSKKNTKKLKLNVDTEKTRNLFQVENFPKTLLISTQTTISTKRKYFKTKSRNIPPLPIINQKKQIFQNTLIKNAIKDWKLYRLLEKNNINNNNNNNFTKVQIRNPTINLSSSVKKIKINNKYKGFFQSTNNHEANLMYKKIFHASSSLCT